MKSESSAEKGNKIGGRKALCRVETFSCTQACSNPAVNLEDDVRDLYLKVRRDSEQEEA
jgi:hypothetical protein